MINKTPKHVLSHLQKTAVDMRQWDAILNVTNGHIRVFKQFLLSRHVRKIMALVGSHGSYFIWSSRHDVEKHGC